MGEPEDLWKALSKAAMRLLSEVDENTPIDVDAIVEKALRDFSDVRGIERYRTSLRDFVRDITDWTPPPRAA